MFYVRNWIVWIKMYFSKWKKWRRRTLWFFRLQGKWRRRENQRLHKIRAIWFKPRAHFSARINSEKRRFSTTISGLQRWRNDMVQTNFNEIIAETEIGSSWSQVGCWQHWTWDRNEIQEVPISRHDPAQLHSWIEQNPIHSWRYHCWSCCNLEPFGGYVEEFHGFQKDGKSAISMQSFCANQWDAKMVCW